MSKISQTGIIQGETIIGDSKINKDTKNIKTITAEHLNEHTKSKSSFLIIHNNAQYATNKNRRFYSTIYERKKILKCW